MEFNKYNNYLNTYLKIYITTFNIIKIRNE